ncbi:aminotransferase class V-fold PLP-dependent enzyme [Chitinibacteraceae bacterium HSL-7]
MFDSARLRSQFPLLAQHPDLIYLDSAATTQKPACVLEAERAYYERHNANVHRSAYLLATQATDAFEAARARVARFFNAASPADVVFTSGTTAAINLVANSWGRATLQAGDEILLSTLEHHANIVPWQLIAAATGARVVAAPVTANGELDLDALLSLINPATRMVAISAMSNATGAEPDLARIIAAARVVGARVLVDAAQAAAHRVLDVQALDADFVVCSAHKMYGPTGIGALIARAGLLDTLPPWQGGGEMIERVSFEGTTFNKAPYRFEAGTPPIAQAIGFAAALDWLDGIDRAALAAHEAALTTQLQNALASLPGVRIIGPAQRGPITSLVFEHAHPFDVAQFLDGDNVAVRVGHHCTQPLMQALGLTGTLRVSFGAYSGSDDVTRFVAALTRTLEDLA